MTILSPVLTPAGRVRQTLRALVITTSLGAAALAGSVSAHAADATTAGSFSPAQRAEIVAIVRDALKTDPTILADAITALRANAQQAQQTATLDAVGKNRAALEHTATDAVFGNPSGRMTLVEFYDPRCPYCRKVLPDLASLVAGDHDLRLVEKIIPVLGDASLLDSKAIVAAGLQGKYGALQNALMSDAAKPSIDRIRTLAQAQGLDVARLERDMNSGTVAGIIQANLDLSRTIGVDGTPTFIIGGTSVIPGAVTVDELRSQIARARAG
ncbi:hypothetical protein AA103196_2527 [Ameyamaea chiangmaiensis NBRC 103196]|uniref:DsbA family protein n=1 Tax=Ameyamaea chiangmaiensis TaxID=442969 RepID=A0A850PI76_9PROT|nr:DsbA family protein [Ameyamaea chiangmaiensis]MBS4075670.1 thioredoxin domain-containing protein [Ameyamaea chiangmaiensis]NVN40921.1 DsbA family protein [Ameyamaea chiangmaiensis]GBQ70580.1 hypothetical protein AA103196_2527 [Ameyamaea chiangmaiensis NBRC 103196]